MTWAEAVAREAAGASIRLDQRLWQRAAKEQAQRLTADPFVDALAHELDGKQGKIAAADVWAILNIAGKGLLLKTCAAVLPISPFYPLLPLTYKKKGLKVTGKGLIR